MENGICPLTGNVCNKDAVYAITEQFGNNKAQSTSCCRDCAMGLIQVRNNIHAQKQHQQNGPTILSPDEFIQKIFSLVGAGNQKTCPTCDSTFQQVKAKGPGCPTCYEFFHDELQPYLNKVQYGPKHVGKEPKIMTSEEQIKFLELALEKCCEAEDFEQAARCRDLIKKMKANMPPSGN